MASLIGRFLSLSPAYPAFLLLFGMILSFATVDLLGLTWHPGITVTLYSSTLAWSLLLAWLRRHETPRLSLLDLLLFAFILVILVSVVLHGRLADLFTGYPRFLPFLLLAPYLCGRVMRPPDIELFARMLAYAGLAFLPLLLWDVYTSPAPTGRQPFFGTDHAPILVGSLLAIALLVVATHLDKDRQVPSPPWQSLLQYALMGLLVGFMVWVSARGWIIGAVFGLLALLSSSYRDRNLRKTYFIRSVFVLGMIWLFLAILPDTQYFFARLLFDPTRFSGQSEFGPILGSDSCLPIKEGADSVAIRWVLYQEAVAQFMLAPIMGNGAGLFGERSCLGTGGFPHSTVLQGFAELGVIGGLALVALLVLAITTLSRMIAREDNLRHNTPLLLVLALLATFLIADQIYGNYFMASGTYFTLGMIAALQGRTTQRREVI